MDPKDQKKEIYATQVRLPRALADRIKSDAEAHHRTFNSELIVLLEIALEHGAHLAASVVPAEWRTGKKKPTTESR